TCARAASAGLRPSTPSTEPIRRHPACVGGTMANWLSTLATVVLAAVTIAGCGESQVTTRTTSGTANRYRFDTTRLCAVVPAPDAALGSTFPQPPPVKVFGTDLGWTYERNGTITMLFGDSWQRIDICPLQLNGDDSLATLRVPPNDWPGYTTHTSLPDAQC